MRIQWIMVLPLLFLCTTDQRLVHENSDMSETPISQAEHAVFMPVQPDIDISPTLEEPKEPDPVHLGVFEVTAYTAGYESTGKRPSHPLYGITASGRQVEEGVTVAADWDILSPGSRIFIDGVGERIVQDRGGAIKGNKLDVYMPDLEDALIFGRQNLQVYLLAGEQGGGEHWNNF